MLRIGKKIEYALMAILEVADHDGIEPVSAKSISNRYHIPAEMLGKVLQTLVKKGLLTSIQGVKGGYTMKKSLDKISLLEVVEAIDGPISLIACCNGKYCTCDQISGCNIKTPMELIQKELVRFFTNISMQDLRKKYGGILELSKINEAVS